jgi:hypothetical protein
MQVATFIAGLLAYAWLLIILQRHGVRKQLPCFALYVLWECLATLTQLTFWLLRSQLYYRTYWWMEAVEIILTVAAVRESFLRIFQGFTQQRGFRWTVWSVIGAVGIYAALKVAYGSPQNTRLDAFVVNAEFLFRWGFLAIAVLSTVLGLLFREGITREDAVVIGFGTAAGAFLFYLGCLAVFGNKYIFLIKNIPAVGYFVAVFWWIYVFSRPLKQFGFEELGMGPDDIRKALDRSRDFGERLGGTE